MSDEILERRVFRAGEIFIKAHEKNNENAYLIQSGEVMSFFADDDRKLVINRYGPGCIIAETNLLINEPMELSFQAIVNTTVVVICRHDFEKKVMKVEKTVLQVLRTLIQKVKDLEMAASKRLVQESITDDKAFEIVSHLLRDMDGPRQKKYEELLLPHFNVMCKALEAIKTEERHERQKQHLEKKLNEISDNDARETEKETV